MISGTSSSASAQNLQSQSATQGRPPPPPKKPASHEDAINHLGASLSSEVRDGLLDQVEVMQAEGASDDEIKAFVDQTLSDNGVSRPSRSPGALLNATA